MSDWTSGYVADIGYTYGYYSELNPLRVKLAFLNAGLVAPEMGSACELGFGQGLSINMHASASVVKWCGTDFMPAQAGFAQQLERVSETGARLYDEAFDQFCNRADLPEFDYIGLHGIWSWISDENRTIIVDFIRRKLKVGGVLYISYNTQPGWAAFTPMRELLLTYKDVMGAEGLGVVANFNAALKFIDRLIETKPAYAAANPYIKMRLSKLKSENSRYLIHEYFNRNWHPMNFSDTAKLLGKAKLNYACSANLLDHFESVNLSAEQSIFLEKIPDDVFRETVRDFMVNQHFRKDYWVKGLRKLTSEEIIDGMRSERLVLASHPSKVSFTVAGPLGEATLDKTIYSPILDILSDHKPRSIAQLEHELKASEKGKDIQFGQLVQAIIVLTGTGALFPAQDHDVVKKLKERTDKLNQHLMTKSRSSSELSYLVSPVTGGGVVVGRFDQIYLLARSQGHKQPSDWAEYAWKILLAQGQRLTKEGQTIDDPEQNIRELVERANLFAEKQLPLLKALQIA